MLKYTIATGREETDICTQYGVHVSSAKGLIGRPDFKEPAHKYSWGYLNGEWIDLANRRYKSREITLKCWLKGSNKQQAINRMNSFLRAFDTSSLIRLHIEFITSSGTVQNGTKGLFYLVYMSKMSMKEVKWRQEKQILNFEITLIEPCPVKRIYKLSSNQVPVNPEEPEERSGESYNVVMAFNSKYEFDVHWGEGHSSYDNIGEGTLTRSYSEEETHYIIVTGVISEIETMTLTCSNNNMEITQIYDEI